MRVYENTGEPRTFRGSVLVGTHSKFFVIDTAEQNHCHRSTFQARWRFSVFQISGGRNCKMSTWGLDALWGLKAVELRDRLLEAAHA